MSAIAIRLTEFADALERDATSLRGDTLVSMAEGMCNELMAKRLEDIAAEIRSIAGLADLGPDR